MNTPVLMAVPNVSEGRAQEVVARIGEAFASGSEQVRLLDVHSDADHDRSVFTLAGPQGELVNSLLAGAREAVAAVDVLSAPADGGAPGQHPHVGALDVAPVVYVRERDRGAACAEALVLGDRLAQELGLPVFLYGELSGEDAPSRRTRAQLRRGGAAGLAARMAAGECAPDFGPARLHRSAGAALVAARPPLVAFNVQLAAPATLARAREIAALIREGGAEGLTGVRAIGIELQGAVAQVSTNVESPLELPLAEVVEAVRAHAPVESAELVGLAPAAAFEGFPADVPVPGFDPARHLLENALGL